MAACECEGEGDNREQQRRQRCSTYAVPTLLYASSAVIGLGAAILWTAQGGFIAACAGQHEEENGLAAHSTMGQFNGLFFSLFQLNQFVGNLLAALLYTYRASQSAVFGMMTVICGCGVATLLLLPRTHRSSSQQRAVEEGEAAVEVDADGDAEEDVRCIGRRREHGLSLIGRTRWLSSLLVRLCCC